MRAGIIASVKLRQLDTTIYETNKVNQLIQGAMRTRPQLPTLPVTFDAADALRRIAQKSTPVEMETAKTMFLLMILGPWRLADVLAMRPSAIIPRGEAYYCALQTKGGRGEYEWVLHNDQKSHNMSTSSPSLTLISTHIPFYTYDCPSRMKDWCMG